MRTNLAAVVMVAGLTAPVATDALAVSPDAASAYVEAMAGRALAALQSEHDRMARFGRLMIESVDFETISKGALGRRGKRVPKDRLNELARLLAADVVNKASDRLRDAEVTGFTVGKARLMPDQDVMVKAVIEISGKDPINTGWRVSERGDGLTIVDIKMQGYSLRIHYMNWFERKIRFGGLDALIKSLRRRVAGTPAMAWVQEAALPAAERPPPGGSRNPVAVPRHGGSSVYPR